jgi:toxin ParE1/3/4
MRIRRLPQADADLDEIWERIARADPDAADRLIARIVATTARLEVYPRSGRARPEIGPNARSVGESDYLILHRITADTVDIVRVVHGSRDLPGLLDDS